MRIADAVVIFQLLLGTTVAFAGDLTPADYQFLKSQMNMSEKQVAEDIDAKHWDTIHRVINSNMPLMDKIRSVNTFITVSSCKDFKKTIPDLECD
jgi:hypothetical protein